MAQSHGPNAAPNSVRKAAEALLPAQPTKGALRAVGHRLADPTSKFAVKSILGYFALVLGLAVAFGQWHVVVAPRFAPADPTSSLETMWQVQAGVVALGFPLLLLFAELTRSAGMLARSSAEVLVRESMAIPGIVFSAACLGGLGMLAVWFPSDASALTMWILGVVPALIFMVWSYWRSLQLFLDQPRLSRQASALLDERLNQSIREAWLVGLANTILQDSLDTLITSRFLSGLDNDGPWEEIRSTRDGRVEDVDARRLRELLVSLRIPISTSAQAQPSETSVSTGPSAILHIGCGDRLRSGDVMIRIKQSSPAGEVGLTADLIRDCFSMVDGDD